VKLILLLVVLLLTGCHDAPLNGRVEVRLTNAGVIVSCVPFAALDERNAPSSCSPVDVKDERSKEAK
jgi:hypothetical protein